MPVPHVDWWEQVSTHVSECETLPRHQRWPTLDARLRGLTDSERSKAIAQSVFDLQTKRHELGLPLLGPDDILASPRKGERERLQRLLTEYPAFFRQLEVQRTEPIGAGGFGTVFREVLGGQVRAVKILKSVDPSLREGTVEPLWRIAREAIRAKEVAGERGHPHIIDVKGFGIPVTPKGKPLKDGIAIAMELLEGGSLFEKCELRDDIDSERVRTSVRRFAEAYGLPADRLVILLLRDIARALLACEERDIVHRDVKPGNVLMRHLPGHAGTDGPCFVLTDFGAAQRSNLSATETMDSGPATPLYKPPEHAQGTSRATPQWDIYSLGAMAHHLVTGLSPNTLSNVHGGPKAVASRHGVTRQEAPPSTGPVRLRPVPIRGVTNEAIGDGNLHRVIERCIEPLARNRYHSAEAIVADCDRLLAGEEPRISRIGALRRASDWLRAHRRTAVAIGAATVLGVAAGSAALFGSLRSESQRGDAATARADLHAARAAVSKAAAARERGELIEARYWLGTVPEPLRDVEWALLDNLAAGDPPSEPNATTAPDAVTTIIKPGVRELALGSPTDSLRLAHIPGSEAVVAYVEQRGRAAFIRGDGVIAILPIAIMPVPSCISMTPKGVVATLALDMKSVNLWSADDLNAAVTIPIRGRSVTHLAAHPSGRRVVVVHDAQRLEAIDVATSSRTQIPIEARWDGADPETSALVRSIMYTPDGRRLLVAFGRSVECLDADSGALQWRVTLPEQSPDPTEPCVLVVSDQSKYCVVAQRSNPITVSVVNVASGRAAHVPNTTSLWGDASVSMDKAGVNAVVLAQSALVRVNMDALLGDGDGRAATPSNAFGVFASSQCDLELDRALLASNTGTVRIVDLDDGGEVLSFAAHTRPIRGLAWLPSSRQLVTTSSDGTVRIWDASRRAKP